MRRLPMPMSAMGHEQTSHHVRVMSVIPLKADFHQRGWHFRLVPLADMPPNSGWQMPLHESG